MQYVHTHLLIWSHLVAEPNAIQLEIAARVIARVARVGVDVGQRVEQTHYSLCGCDVACVRTRAVHTGAGRCELTRERTHDDARTDRRQRA
jgi:hypothetical protein